MPARHVVDCLERDLQTLLKVQHLKSLTIGCV